MLILRRKEIGGVCSDDHGKDKRNAFKTSVEKSEGKWSYG
jgi:hypothetical protein